MTRRERDADYRRTLIGRLARVPLDRDYDNLRERAARALALEAAVYAHTDRLAALMDLPAIDWPAAQTALVAAHTGLRLAT